MIPLPLWWRFGAALALCVAAFGAGWLTNGWRWEARHAVAERAHADALASAQSEALARTAMLNRRIAALDAAYTDDVMEARREADALRADLDAGRKRLRVAATCPHNVSAASGAPGRDHGSGAELTADARSAYLDLRAGITDVTARLQACQEYIERVVYP